MVVYNLSLSTMFLHCLINPDKNPVPKIERTFPIEYVIANLYNKTLVVYNKFTLLDDQLKFQK